MRDIDRCDEDGDRCPWRLPARSALHNPITEAEARAIFEHERQAFATRFPDMPPIKLVMRRRHFEPKATLTDRDLAWYEWDKRRVCLLWSALDRSAGTVRGLIRHELGHAADRRIQAGGAEVRADRLAEEAIGSPVRYTADGVQHATHGQAGRPRRLGR